jgi:hypothetical protein
MSIIEDNIINSVDNNIMNSIDNNLLTDKSCLSDKSCNICTENIDTTQLVTLACNPNHYFCYTCIFDWYNTIKHNPSTFTFSSNENKQCTCPICKKDGGILPLLPPHIEPIIGIHAKGVISFSPTLFGATHQFNGITDSKCDHKDCISNYQNMNVLSKPDIDGIILNKNLCNYHFDEFKKGKNLILENDDIFESPYIMCHCKMPNNKKCNNTTMYTKMYITLNNKKYYFCNDHTKLYNHGIQLTFNDGVIAIKNSTHKMICCFTNKKLKYGYCLHKLNNHGTCKTKLHNINILYNEVEQTNIITENNKKVINGLCGTTLKNGSGTCQNKGKAEHNGKCGKHKNYE